MAENLNIRKQFQENRMEFDEKIVMKVDDQSLTQEVLRTMLESGILFDVTLITEPNLTSVLAHRVVLAAVSDYFSSMFTTDMMEKNQKEIKIKGVTGESLKSLVNYCYTGQIEINSTNAVDLLAAASMMRFEKIEDECRKFLEKQLEAHPESSLSVHSFAHRYSFTELAKNSLKNICENFRTLLKTSNFNEIGFNLMEQILDSDELFIDTEEEIFEAAMNWVAFDRNERQQFIPNILKLIRLPQIDPTYLFEIIKPICDTNNCSELITTALYWQSLPKSKRLRLLPVKQTTKRTTSLKMLVIGGNAPFDIISMEIYCPRSKKWISRNQIKCPTLRDGSRRAVIDETVYVTGGESVFCFDFRTLKLFALPPMEIARRYHGIGVINKNLYVIGGSNILGQLSSVERYDLQENEWRLCAPMPKAKSECGVAVLNGYLYVIGGYDDNERVNSVERYSPSDDTWSPVKPMNNRRTNPGVGVLNERIYVAGGCDDNCLDSVEYYDASTDLWTTIASLSTPRSGIAIAVYENKIFAIGGLCLSIVERYDENEDNWTTIEPLNSPRSYSTVTIIRST